MTCLATAAGTLAVKTDRSSAFKREFEAKASNPNNPFHVEMMPRNPHTSACFLPGSGIKGAIRTAVVNHFANRVATMKAGVHRAVEEARQQYKGQTLEERSLNRRHSETQRDVFRLISVADAELPQGSTRIDKAINIKPRRDQEGQIAMWVERLESMENGKPPMPFGWLMLTLQPG